MKKLTKTIERKALIQKMDTDYAKHAVAKHVWGFDSGKSGPTFTLFEGVHGNETYDFEVLREIISILQQQGLQFGKVIAGIGNCDAYISGERFVGVDLNRCFGPNLPNPKCPSKRIPYEHKRVQVLKPLLEKSDFFLDLHATMKPSEPFLVVPNSEHEYMQYLTALGINKALTGAGIWPPSGEPVYADTYAACHGAFAATYEGGWLEELNPKVTIQSVKNLLCELGILDGIDSESFQESTDILNVYWNVIAGENFKFTRDWANFEKVPAGTVFAFNDGMPLQAENDSIIVFPKPNHAIQAGMEACLIAE